MAKSEIPFIIHTPDNLDVEVLGTTFSITAYPEDECYLVSLLEGKVEVGDPLTKLTMAPGEIISYNRSTKNMERLDKDVSHMYGWMDNKLYMDNMSLAAVCKTLERWYDVKITLAAGLGESANYTGVLREDNITDVLNALCSLSNIKYEMNGRHISITPK
ncbi:MAG: FecR family protein [Tannerellaceae bacterium]|nr:FecR family protein [Tannerellaceae bacterium]MCD8263047.1 FecR family protein [Tannerellaceae bacterium]